MDSAVVAAYSEDPILPAAGVAAAQGLSPTIPARPSDVAAARTADELLRQLAAEAGDAGPSVAGGLGETQRRPRVLLCVSGSVATVKLALVSEALLDFADVHIISSNSARHFFKDADLPPACLPVFVDEDEWRNWQRVGDPVVHIELRRWADALVIAPLSANTLAKVANGLCDNLLTCVVRAWDFSKPVIAAPAMNTFMWESPFTARHLDTCKEFGIEVVPPVSKALACGDVGNGAMAAPMDIALATRNALITAGFALDTT